MNKYIYAFLHRVTQGWANYFFEKLEGEAPVYYVADYPPVTYDKKTKLFTQPAPTINIH